MDFLSFFVGEYNLLSTSATKVYVNLKIPEIARVLDNYNYFLLRKWKLTLFFFLMNRLNNVTISKIKELKIDRPPMIPDKEFNIAGNINYIFMQSQ
jgi:hypothetical protein